MSEQSAIEQLAIELEALIGFTPKTKEDLDRWYEGARRLEAELVRPGGLSPKVPHFLWHYLADADIRMKDEKYAGLHNRRINLLLQYLKKGEIPSDEGIED